VVLSLLRPLVSLIPFDLLPNWFFSDVLLGRLATPELRTLLKSSLAMVSPSVFKKRLREVAVVDASQSLSSYRSPILYLRASQDLLVPKASCGQVCALHPSTKVVVLQGSHCLLQVAPTETANSVVAFMREVENAA
jgi:pimeloyl-[acyl-carrier protein] methyl ester esterase